MIKKIFKKLLGFKGDKVESKVSVSLKGKINNISSFVDEKIDLAKKEYFETREKLGNLRETNYSQGLRYIEKGHLKDAVFRFRFIKKFWPEMHDAYYQLAYCLYLRKKPYEAKAVLIELLQKNPQFGEKANHLLVKIEQSIDNAY